MTIFEFLQRLWRKFDLWLPNPIVGFHTLLFRLRGAKIGKGTRMPRCRMVWPHQVSIGRNCILQHDIFFNYDHYWTPGPSILIGDRVFIGHGVEFNCRDRVSVGDDALIAAGCRFIDHDHGTAPGELMRIQEAITAPIEVGKGAWLGVNVVILKGVCIGDGAVVGAGSVVTKSIPAGETWAGVPAKLLRQGTRIT